MILYTSDYEASLSYFRDILQRIKKLLLKLLKNKISEIKLNKKIFKLLDVKFINVPKFEEFNVKKI